MPRQKKGMPRQKKGKTPNLTIRDILDLYINGDIRHYINQGEEVTYDLFSSVKTLNHTFGIGSIAKAKQNCIDYLKTEDVELLLSEFLDSFILHSDFGNIYTFNSHCMAFFDFYINVIGISKKISIEVFLNLFSNKESFRKVNNYLLMNYRISYMLESVENLSLYITDNNKKQFLKFLKLVHTKNSDYNPLPYTSNYENKNKISGKNFKGLPTRVYYGLFLQWNYNTIHWRGKPTKSTTTENRLKFEYFIENENRQGFLEKLAEKSNCTVKDIIDLFIYICDIEYYITDPHIQYLLRAFYLYEFLSDRGLNIRTNKNKNPFQKKVKNEKGSIVNTDGTFLSEVYDAYNQATFEDRKDKREKVKKAKETYAKKKSEQQKKNSEQQKKNSRSKSPITITNNLSNKLSNKQGQIIDQKVQ